MAISREYATGRSKVFSATGMLTLNGASNEGHSSPSHALDTWWSGTGYVHPRTRDGSADWGGGDQCVVLGSWAWTGVTVWSGGDGRRGGGGSPGSPSGDSWRTRIYAGSGVAFAGMGQWDDNPDIPTAGTLLQTWIEDAAPSPVVLNWRSEFTANEYVREYYSSNVRAAGGSPSARPRSPRDSEMDYVWVPTGNIVTVVSGSASGTVTEDALTVVGGTVGTVTYSARGKWNGRFQKGAYFWLSDPPDCPDPDALDDWPTGNFQYGRVDQMAVNGAGIREWTRSMDALNEPAIPSQTIYNATSETFAVRGYGYGYQLLSGTVPIETLIDGRMRDWNNPVYHIPMTIGATTEEFTAKRTVPETAIDPSVAPPAGYQASDSGAAIVRDGDEWDALLIDHDPTLSVEGFALADWTGTDCSLSKPGSLLVAVATGASPRVDKTLVSDFDAMRNFVGPPAGPAGWWAANGGTLDALTAAERAAVTAWWEGTGYQSGSPHLGNWYKIGRKLMAASDVFNWSSYRYADLTASADAACDVTLTVYWDEIAFAMKVGSAELEHDVTLAVTPKSTDFTVSLTTSSAARRIDLASQDGHHAFRYITALRVAFPAGRTVSLSSVSLAEVNRPRIDVHLPTDDLGHVQALADGKNALWLSSPDSAPPNSTWGWPCYLWYDGTLSSDWMSHLTSILAAEISLQEGWRASVPTDADVPPEPFAAWLSEAFDVPCPATLKGQRALGLLNVNAYHDQDVVIEANLGNAIVVLAFDPDTRLPVQVTVEAVDPDDGKVDDAGITDAAGIGRLETTEEKSYTLRFGRGGASEFTDSATTLNRTKTPQEGTAKEEGVSSGPAVLDIDRQGSKWSVYTKDNKLVLRRLLGHVGAPNE